MFHDVFETADSGFAVVHIVTNTVVTGIKGSDALKGAGEETELEAQAASFHGFAGITKFALVADWGAKSPAAGLLVKISKTARFTTGPTIVAHGDSTGGIGAEAADKNLVKDAVGSTHFKILNKN